MLDPTSSPAIGAAERSFSKSIGSEKVKWMPLVTGSFFLAWIHLLEKSWMPVLDLRFCLCYPLSFIFV